MLKDIHFPMDNFAISYLSWNFISTHKQLEMHGCMFSNVATGALVLKQKAIDTHYTD